MFLFLWLLIPFAFFAYFLLWSPRIAHLIVIRVVFPFVFAYFRFDFIIIHLSESSRSKGKVMKRTLIIFLMGLIAFIILIPFLWTLSTSFKPLTEVNKYPPQWLSPSMSFKPYGDMFHFLPFSRYTLNSVVIAISAGHRPEASRDRRLPHLSRLPRTPRPARRRCRADRHRPQLARA